MGESPHALPGSTPHEKPKLNLSDYYPAPLQAAEKAMIKRRRERAKSIDPERLPHSGIGLSGGGIRSATFCLGVLQALAKAKVLRQLDYLSSASGGGFTGSFLGAWMSRDGVDMRVIEQQLPRSDSRTVGFLRENGRYIAPNGSGDLWAAFATALRSWVALLFVLGVFTLAFFLLAAAGRESLWDLGVWRPGFISGWPCAPGPYPRLWPSVWWTIAKDLALVLVVPFIIAFWQLGQRPRTLAPIAWLAIPASLAAMAVAAFGFAWAVAGKSPVPGFALPGLGLGGRLLLGLAGAATLVALFVSYAKGARTPEPLPGVPDKVGPDLAPARRWLTDILAAALGATAAAAAFALVDTLAASLLAWEADGSLQRTVTLHAAGVAAIAAGKFIWPHVSKSPKAKKRPSLPVSLLAGAAAAILAIVLFTLLDFWALRLAKGLGAWSALGDGAGHPAAALLAASAALFVLCLFLGHPLGLVNLSSEHKIYSARLTRAYLGASNANRFNAAAYPNGQNITDPIPGDDMGMGSYLPHEKGGPLHVINVTVNETISGVSQVEQRDRKGMGMAIGPAGMSLGRVHHSLFADPALNLKGAAFVAQPAKPVAPGRFQPSQVRMYPLKPPAGSVAVMGYREPAGSAVAAFTGVATPPALHEGREMESLPLGDWVGVSGAAFSTGMGFQTSLGLSFLAGIFNVRLGYWWDSGIIPGREGNRTPPSPLGRLARVATYLFPAQLLLIDELLARFHGTALKYWYLSDGGHFENTATYELIRRRVPVMIVCDCGADPDYTFDDVGNLVRKARLDFNAEITFLDAAKLKARFGSLIPDAVGSIDELRQANPVKSLGKVSARHAALARVRYTHADPPAPDSLLLLVKPTLTGGEPADVLNYRSSHRVFPQEPTSDQFFDEAQWESYRKLGEWIGAKLFPGEDAATLPWLWALAAKL